MERSACGTNDDNCDGTPDDVNDDTSRYNVNRIYIKLSAGGVPASHTLWSSGWVRFSDQISGERAQAIRATALLALANDHQVGLHSNGNDCREATQIAIKPAVSGS